MRSSIDKRAMALLSGGHAATDLPQGAVAALLVFWRPELGLSYTEVTAVVLVAAFSSSVIQPFFGIWSDRYGMAWLLPLGIAVSGIGIGLASVAPSYPLLLLFVFISGVGVAAYHPEASKFAKYVSGRRRSGGMSLFSIGGNLGFALGPLLASTLVLALGLAGGLILAIPAIIFATLMAWLIPYLKQFAPEPRAQVADARGQDNPRALGIVLAIVALRSVGHMGLFAFIPLWEVSKGNGEAYGNQILFLFLFVGAIGTLIGGPVADRIGTRMLTGLAHGLSVPLILVYVLTTGPGSVVAVALAGGLLVSTFAVTIVMGHDYMPSRVGLSSGLTIGLSIGLGGIAAVALGAVADTIGVKTAVLATVSGPALAALLTLFLPRAPCEEPAPSSAGLPARVEA